MFDTELFIQKIEEKPSIWDVRSADYKNRVKKFNDWSDIASIMTKNWSSLTEEEKQIKGQELTKKWKNIKDKYRKVLKDINNVKSGSADDKIKKTYTYFNLLHFLRPVLEENILESNISPEENSNVSVTDIENFETQFAEPEIIIEPEKRKNTSKRKNNDECEQELLEILRKRNSLEEKTLQDEDVLFLLSLAPTLKKMTPLTKMRTKIAIMTSITNNMSETPDVQTNSYIYKPTTSSYGYSAAISNATSLYLTSVAPTTSQYENTTTVKADPHSHATVRHE